MQFEYFIAKRILKSEREGKKVSRPIVRIAVICIALALIVNLITIAVVTGFQHEVRNKVVGFGAHGTITNIRKSGPYEVEPIRRNPELVRQIKLIEGVAGVSAFAYKPALLQSESDTVFYKRKDKKDTFEVQQEIQSVLLKGVEKDYNWDFFKQYLKQGKLPEFKGEIPVKEILISQKIADALRFHVGDEVKCFFVKQQPILNRFRVVGIYETGLEEFDKELIIGDLRIVQQLNDWGLSSGITIDDTLDNYNLLIRAQAQGGNGNYAYQWNKKADTYLGFTFCPEKDTTIRLIVSDYFSKPGETSLDITEPDTSYLDIKVSGEKGSACDCQNGANGLIKKRKITNEGNSYELVFPNKVVKVSIRNGQGSYSNYLGGYEIRAKDWVSMFPAVKNVKGQFEFIPTMYNEQISVEGILETQNDIFVWLGFLDINVWIILTLMIVIGVINMGSAMLVIILLRTSTIGLFKTLGATNGSVIRIFLIQCGILIVRGLIWGNVIGLGLYFAQKELGLIPLDPSVYFLNKVPVELHLWHWIALNAGMLLVCLITLLLPALVILKITPVKALKFN